VIILGGFAEFVGGVGAQTVQPQPPFANQFGVYIANLYIAGKINQPGQVMVVILNGFLRAVLFDFQIFKEICFGFRKKHKFIVRHVG
jgi:hypothetical protein